MELISLNYLINDFSVPKIFCLGPYIYRIWFIKLESRNLFLFIYYWSIIDIRCCTSFLHTTYSIYCSMLTKIKHPKSVWYQCSDNHTLSNILSEIESIINWNLVCFILQLYKTNQQTNKQLYTKFYLFRNLTYHLEYKLSPGQWKATLLFYEKPDHLHCSLSKFWTSKFLSLYFS